MSIIYLSPQLIEDDHLHFATSIQQSYNVDNCVMYQETNDNNVVNVGFEIKKDQQRFLVVKSFLENEAGEWGVLKNCWEVRREEGEKVEDLPSLKEVFDEIGISKTK